ncbi:MAG: ATP-binding protein [Acidobacteriota bacterium]
MFDSVRIRLTLWYAAVLSLSLIAFAMILYYAAAAVFHERQDESLHSTARTVASVYIEELEEEQSALKATEVVLTETAFPDRYLELTDSSGRATAWSRNLSNGVFSLQSQTLTDARRNGVGFVRINNLRVAIVPLSAAQELGFAAVAEPVSVVEEGLRRLRRYLYAGVPLILLLTSAGGYFLARKSLSPISLMNMQTRRITAERLSSRLDVQNPRDELGGLATTINDLLTRLEASFSEQQRFVADASHELRTPLAVLRGETEVALSQPREIDEYKESLALIKDEAERLSRIVEDLFVLARQPIDAPAKLMNEPVSLNQIAGDCVRAAQVLAKRKDLRMAFDEQSRSLTMRGDEELLKRMLLNLLDNAVKYTPEGGEIRLELSSQNGNARLTVSDTGIGIPKDDQSKIFDRFYRVDKARSRALGGRAWDFRLSAGSSKLMRDRFR